MVKPAVALFVVLSLAACCNCPDSRMEQTQPVAELPEGELTEQDYGQLTDELASRMHCRVAHGEPEKCTLVVKTFETTVTELRRDQLVSRVCSALERRGFKVVTDVTDSPFPRGIIGASVSKETHHVGLTLVAERGKLAHYVLEASVTDLATNEVKKHSSSVWKRARTA